MSMIRFANLIGRYSVACMIIRIENTWNADGESVKTETNLPLRAAILPIDAKLMQLEGGRYTMDDRAIYSLIPLRNGDIIQREDCRYTIDHELDYSEYADYNKYIARRVSSHG